MTTNDIAPSAPVSSKKNIWLELFLLSVISLFLELFIVRWSSVDIRAFTTLKFFPLATCFVGLGVGFALGKDRMYKFVIYPLLAFVIMVRIAEITKMSYLFFPSSSQFVWASIDRLDPQTLTAYVFAFTLLMPIFLSAPFALCVAIGSKLGVLFNQLKPLNAYCINIVGAIVGSILFSLLSFFGLSPWQLLIAPLLVLLYFLRDQKFFFASVLAAFACIGFAIWNPTNLPNQETFWSPYQRLDLEPFTVKAKNGQDVLMGYDISSNHSPYQNPVNLSAQFLNSVDVDNGQVDELIRRYKLTYEIHPSKDVLIVGAGSGNDAAAALRAGSERIDAVDIDPVIINIGKERHPEKPYQNDKVQIFCDDARGYFNNCKKKYDLVAFSHLDSHIVTGQSSSVRIDNYVYTRESFRNALKLLKPDGLMVVSFNTTRDWFTKRLFATLSEAAGYPALVVRDKRDRKALATTYFIAGNAVREGKLIFPEAIEKNLEILHVDTSQARVLTDDWPYVYLASQDFDFPYAVVVLEFLLISIFWGGKFLTSAYKPLNWQMFFLGSGFLLLELQSIARLSLVYGTTWQTSAIVIVSILLMILAANLILLKTGPIKQTGILYGLLVTTLLVSYFLPMSQILQISFLPTVVNETLITFLTVLPMFMAALIFGSAFATCDNPGRALAFNLFGSVVGALLEYSSNYIGVRNLVLVALCLYLCSCFFAFKKSKESS